jgi:hypothetical protein
VNRRRADPGAAENHRKYFSSARAQGVIALRFSAVFPAKTVDQIFRAP